MENHNTKLKTSYSYNVCNYNLELSILTFKCCLDIALGNFRIMLLVTESYDFSKTETVSVTQKNNSNVQCKLLYALSSLLYVQAQ